MSTHGFALDIDRLSALYRYGIIETATEPFFDAIVREVSAALGGMAIRMVLVDDQRLWTKAAAGESCEEHARQGSLTAAAIEQATPLEVEDAAADPRFGQSPAVLGAPYLRAYAGVCFRSSDGHPIGVLYAADTTARSFRPAHIAVLDYAAGRIAAALEQRLVARTDVETGALTAAAFHDQAAALATLTARHRIDLSLLAVSIDPFRALLTRFKADLGRLVVERMGSLGRTRVRRVDSFGRLDDGVFAVLLPDTGPEGAGRLAARVAEALAEGWSLPLPEAIATPPVGLGVATFRPGLDTASDVIQRALAACRPTPHADRPAATRGDRVA